MGNLNTHLFDSAIELQLDISRLDAYTQGQVVSLLKNLEDELTAKVAKSDYTSWGKVRIAKQLSEADGIIRKYYDEASGVAVDATTAAGQTSISATESALSVAVGGQVATALPPAQYLDELVSNSVVQGAVQADWWNRQAADTSWRFAQAVRQGAVASETTPQIMKRVMQVMEVSKNNAATLVSTSLMTVANNARDKTFEENSDIVSGKEYVSTLDNRTCITCAAYDNKRFTLKGKPIGHSLPYAPVPQHFRCRCLYVPVLKTWKELGVDIEEVPTSTRASMTGQVSDTSFSEWLSRQSSAKQIEILGAGRADLYQRGVVTFGQLTDGRANPLTLEQITTKYGKK